MLHIYDGAQPGTAQHTKILFYSFRDCMTSCTRRTSRESHKIIIKHIKYFGTGNKWKMLRIGKCMRHAQIFTWDFFFGVSHKTNGKFLKKKIFICIESLCNYAKWKNKLGSEKKGSIDNNGGDNKADIMRLLNSISLHIIRNDELNELKMKKLPTKAKLKAFISFDFWIFLMSTDKCLAWDYIISA